MNNNAAAGKGLRTGKKAWYSLFIFFLVYTMINVDRGILAVMIEPIKNEFQLNDSQIGFLTGIAFALFFGIAGIPLGRWSDHGNRKTVLCFSLFVFSAMTAAGGFAAGYLHLLVTRLIVGAGEAGGGPSSLSMLSDHFPPERRATAISLYYLGSPTGQFLVFFLGGLLVASFGWRSTFWAAGGLGLLLMLLIILTVEEPQRKSDHGASVGDTPSFKSVLVFILQQRSLRHILGTGMITSAVVSGVSIWTVSVLIRSYDFDVKTAGAAAALAFGGGAAVGIGLSGWIVDRLGILDIRWRIWFCALTQLFALPMLLLYLLAPSPIFAVIGLTLLATAQSTVYAPIVSLCQTLVGPRMRGSTMAVYYFLANFVGFGLGPQIIGIASDLLHPQFGADSLRMGQFIFVFFFLWAAFHFYRAGHNLERDLERVTQSS